MMKKQASNEASSLKRSTQSSLNDHSLKIMQKKQQLQQQHVSLKNQTSTKRKAEMEQMAVFSFKVIVHRVNLTRHAFQDNHLTILKPGIRIKFADFPYLHIMGNTSIKQESCITKEGVLRARKREEIAIADAAKSLQDGEDNQNKNSNNTGHQFNKGKSVLLNARQVDMMEYLRSSELVVQLKDFDPEGTKPKLVGRQHLKLSAFYNDAQTVIAGDLERFRRNTFQLDSFQGDCVGWLDMSLSIVQRPVSYWTKTVTQKLGSLENSQNYKNIQQQDEVMTTKKKENIEIRRIESIYQDPSAGKSNIINENSPVSPRYASKISDKSQQQHQEKQKKNQQVDQSIEDDSQQQYDDDFEASSIHQQSSQRFTGKTPKQKINSSIANQSENYEEDFESMNSSLNYQSMSIPKRAGSLVIVPERRKSVHYEVSTSKINEESVSEIYADDFQNSSISQSVHAARPKNQLKPIR